MIDRLLFTIKGVRTALRNCVLFSFVAGALIAIQALCLTTTLVNLWYSQALLNQIPFIAGFLACLIARQILDNAQSKWLETFAANRADEFREALFEKLFKQGQTLIQQKGTGGFATLLIEGVDQVESYLHMILPRMTKLVIIPVMLLVLLFVFDWVSALIGLLVFPAIILQMVLIGHTASLEAGKQHKEYQRLANHFLDSIRGIDTLKFFGRSKAHAQRIFESSERFRKATMKTLRVATLSGAVLDAFSTVSIAAIAVLLGFRLVDGSLGLYPALFVLVVMPDYFRPIREFASDYHASLDGKNSLRSIVDTLGANDGIGSESTGDDAPVTINATAADKKSAVGSITVADNESSAGSTTTVHSSSGKTAPINTTTPPSSREFSFELRNVSFAYGPSSSSSSENTFALENISATFFGRQRIG
ncbi:MAG: ABC transporter transmembrane domain-containing protein, partial [Eggerthellaceae bacterium]|nr:ABC transporter transmembrane domain-containing protein [Eggerthellaceae bacterium]